MKKQRILSLCMASLLALSLMACNGPTDEQNSAQPTASTQPTTAPTPTPTPPIPYTDVAEDSTYYDAVVWAFKNGIATDGETFEPASPCTRGQFMTFLWRANGSPEPQATESPFNDVSSADWFYKPALWAYENGIATGTAFNPGNPCTNAEALTFLWRAEGKPAASVYNSAVALAASGQYYARPAAWAETNGLFAGANFDPATPCSRADLMMYLHWATEEWEFAEEDRAVQAEFEQIIYDAQLFEVHGSGLCFADYIDVDGDGETELLTVGVNGESLTVSAYKNIGGHIEKLANADWGTLPSKFTICQSGNEACLCYAVVSNDYGVWENYDFWKIENGEFVYTEGAVNNNGAYKGCFPFEELITEAEYRAILQKYTNQKVLFTKTSNRAVSIQERGLLPSPEEYKAALAEQWETEREKIYTAVKNGDFSFFAGDYTSEYGSKLELNKDGAVTGGYAFYITNQKPSSITVAKNGVIECYLGGKSATPGSPFNDGWDSYYEIYPIGVSSNFNSNDDSREVRIIYYYVTSGIEMELYTKIS